MNKVEQVGIPGVGVTTANAVWIAKRGTWAATRFGLFRNKRRKTMIIKKLNTEQKTHYNKMELYELNVLPPEYIPNFLSFLEKESIQHEFI